MKKILKKNPNKLTVAVGKKKFKNFSDTKKKLIYFFAILLYVD